MRFTMYELSKTPIGEDEWVYEDIILDSSFVGSIADYVTTMTLEEREESILDFVQSFPEGTVLYDSSEESIVFAENIKEIYFNKKFELFKEKASLMTFDEFVHGPGYKVHEIQNLISAKSDNYVYSQEEAWTSMDTFFRYVTPGQKYYFGGAIAFHS